MWFIKPNAMSRLNTDLETAKATWWHLCKKLPTALESVDGISIAKMYGVVKSQEVLQLSDSLNQITAFMMFVRCWAELQDVSVCVKGGAGEV